ncbi:MAG TPA: DUF427 domain-containing protein [Gaiellaceae bacterium]|nr:DUF427 domain-containing protein [Gaiellaceae bacterium]
MKAIWNGAVVAESDDTVVVEGNHYFPAASLDRRYLVDSEKHTVCPWKGVASYYSLDVDGRRNDDAVWYYRDPKPEAERVAGRVAFWRGVDVVASDTDEAA